MIMPTAVTMYCFYSKNRFFGCCYLQFSTDSNKILHRSSGVQTTCTRHVCTEVVGVQNTCTRHVWRQSVTSGSRPNKTCLIFVCYRYNASCQRRRVNSSAQSWCQDMWKLPEIQMWMITCVYYTGHQLRSLLTTATESLVKMTTYGIELPVPILP